METSAVKNGDYRFSLYLSPNLYTNPLPKALICQGGWISQFRFNDTAQGWCVPSTAEIRINAGARRIQCFLLGIQSALSQPAMNGRRRLPFICLHGLHPSFL